MMFKYLALLASSNVVAYVCTMSATNKLCIILADYLF